MCALHEVHMIGATDQWFIGSWWSLDYRWKKNLL